MSLSPFRSVGTRAAALATAGVLGMSALGIFPAAAQETGSASCRDLAQKTDRTHSTADASAEFKCELREVDRRVEQAKQRGVEADRRGVEADRRGLEADRRGSEADVRKACSEALTAWLKDDKLSKDQKTAALNVVLNGRPSNTVPHCEIIAKLTGKAAALTNQ